MTTTARIEHTGNAAITTITGGIGPTDLTINIADATGWPTGATGVFYGVIDDGEPTVEKIKFTSRSGTTLTVANAADRGEDGTSAQSHANGRPIHVCFTALEADQANAHTSASSGVHGVAGSIVDTTTAQTIGGPKTFTNPVLTSPNLDGTTDNSGATISGGTVSGADITGGTIGPTTVDDLLTFSGSGALRGAIIEAAGTGSSDHALIVRERSGGAGRLIELRNSAGTTVGYLTEDGFASLGTDNIQIGNGFGNNAMLRVISSAAANVIGLFRGHASQTADLFRVENNAGGVRLIVQAAGSTRIDPPLTNAVALLLRGLASQTADILKIQDSAGNDLFAVGPAGQITAASTAHSIGAFQTWTPTLTANTTNPTLGSGAVQQGRYQRLGNGLIYFSATIVFGTSGVSAGSGLYTISLPVAPIGVGTFNGIQQVVGSIEDVSVGTRLSCSGWIQDGTTGIVRLIYGGGTGAVGDSATNCSVGSTTPWTWAASDRLDFSGIYMAA